MEQYADYLIRGIPKEDYIIEDSIRYQLFSDGAKDTNRNDGFEEISINWYDDESALLHILNQKKEDNTKQFKAGAAILSRKKIHKQMKIHKAVKNILSYERGIPVEGNPYHGNILVLKKSEEIIKVDRITAFVALTFCLEAIEHQSNE